MNDCKESATPMIVPKRVTRLKIENDDADPQNTGPVSVRCNSAFLFCFCFPCRRIKYDCVYCTQSEEPSVFLIYPTSYANLPWVIF